MEVYTKSDGVYYLIGTCTVDPAQIIAPRHVVNIAEETEVCSECGVPHTQFKSLYFKVELFGGGRTILIADSIEDAGHLPGFVQCAMCPQKIKEQLGGLMRKLFLLTLLFCLPIIVGINRCQTMPNYYYDAAGQYVEITNPPEQCVLYRVLGNTIYYREGLFAMNYAALKKGYYTADQAIEQLDTIEKAVTEKTATVGSVINTLVIVAGKATKVGAPEIVLVTEGLAPYRSDTTPLDDCTRYKLIAYIGSQRNLCLAFGG